MAHYTQYYGYRQIHWACVECLVRPMCNKRCHKSYHKHQLCEGCNECNGYPCEKVQKVKMFEMVWESYGDQVLKYYEESTLYKLLSGRHLVR